ncbi:hypothetical protein QYE76_007971 [Lolium multiflorum]|uniref:Transposase (putative) gypsy type domain-containing protein n=1 Tax=Lolium multiflorum TaxID=4521 RepID=A0AAD8QHK5_LOLMU|nr:hypothetical protein QYE76_007971 [Lolium multiflorum]
MSRQSDEREGHEIKSFGSATLKLRKMVAMYHHREAEEPRGGGVSEARKLEISREILKTYGLQPHNISPNSVLAISNHVALCEGHLRVTPELPLFQYFFTVKKIRQSGELATCGTITFMLRPGRVYPPTDRHESARYWSGGFFYLKDVSDPASARKLPAFKNCPANELRHACPPLFRLASRRPAAVGGSASSRRRADGKGQPFLVLADPAAQHEDMMFEYGGRGLINARHQRQSFRRRPLDKRGSGSSSDLCELHVHLEALEENELGTLLRVPSTSNADPEAASEAEAPEASRPAKRKKPAPSSPHAKRARDVLSIAATRKLEAEKKRLSMINTSNKGQTAIQHFFKPSGQPPKAARVLKKRARPSPASFPITPEVEVPPKASSASKMDPKDIINIDDLPEDPARHGDSAKGTSSPAPPPDQPSSAFAEPTEEEQEQKAKLLQTTRKLHEDLRVHVLEQITEIEGLRQNAENSQKAIQLLETRLQEETAKHSSFNELAAKVKVLEAENESLKTFIQESSNKETEARKELSEKHARDKAELIDKLEKSQGRVISLISKNRVLEEEAETIDKLIFPSLGFEWSNESNLKRTEAYDEARKSIDALFEACRGIATALSLKKAKTTVIDTMTKLMGLVPDFIKDWQKSSARGVASLVLACQAHFLAQLGGAEPEFRHEGALSRNRRL